MKKGVLYAHLSLLLSALGWGISGQLIQTALTELTATQIIFWRFAIAALLALLGLVIIKPSPSIRMPISTPTDIINSLLLSLPLVIVYYSATYAVMFATPTTVAFVAGASVLLVPLFEGLTTGKRLAPASYIEAAIAFTGLAIIALQDNAQIEGSLQLQNSLQLKLGVLLSLFNAIGYAAYIVLAGMRLQGISPPALARINGFQYLWVSLFSGALAIAEILIGSSTSYHATINLLSPSSWIVLHNILPWTTLHDIVPWTTVFAVIGLGILSTYLPFTLQLKAQQLVAPARVSQLLATIPLFTAALATLLGQIPTIHTLLGGALIVLSILLPTLKRGRGLITKAQGVGDVGIH